MKAINFHGLVADEDYAQRCIMILENSNDQDELNAMIAEIALETVHELAYIPEPPKPTVLVQWEQDLQRTRLSASELEKKRQRLYDMDEVINYIAKASHIASRNMSNAKALEQYIQTWLDWGEPAKGQKCWLIYNDYPGIITVSNRIAWQRKGFKGSPNQ